MTLTANDCPSCQQLQRELAAAVQRAEQAEADLKIAEQHLAAGRVIQDGLRSDLAAARRERDALRVLIPAAERAAYSHYGVDDDTLRKVRAAREALAAEKMAEAER